MINFCIVFCHVLQLNFSLVPSRKSLLRAWSLSVLHHLAPLLLLHALLHHRGHLHHQVMQWCISGSQEYSVSSLWDELWSPQPNCVTLLVWGSMEHTIFSLKFLVGTFNSNNSMGNNSIIQYHLNIIVFA